MTKVIRIDTCGMPCPQPVLVLGNATVDAPVGAIVEITGDCSTFEQDIRAFCDRREKTVLAVLGKPPKITVQIQY